MSSPRRSLSGPVIVALAVVASLVFVLAIVQLAAYAPPADSSHNDIATVVHAALGIIYGVMLAQIVVAAWGDYESVQDATSREAAALVDLSRLLEGLSRRSRQEIAQALVGYACVVETCEWPAMERGGGTYERGEEQLTLLYRLFAQTARDQTTDGAFLDAALAELDELGDARGTRLSAVRWHLPWLMWAALIGGGFLVVAFVPVFADEDGSMHFLMILALSVALILIGGLVYALDHPFTFPWGISSDAFARARRRLGLSAGAAIGCAALGSVADRCPSAGD